MHCAPSVLKYRYHIGTYIDLKSFEKSANGKECVLCSDQTLVTLLLGAQHTIILS